MTKYKGSCHCGDVAFEIDGTLENIVECNCSICSKRAHLLWFVPTSDIRFINGGNATMGAYQFNDKHISHRFCKNCGVAILSDGELDGVVKAGINIRILEDVDISKIETYKYDGKAL